MQFGGQQARQSMSGTLMTGSSTAGSNAERLPMFRTWAWHLKACAAGAGTIVAVKVRHPGMSQAETVCTLAMQRTQLNNHASDAGAGTIVAVKVRHPGVSQAIQRDFALMMRMARVASLVPFIRELRLEDTLVQFAAPLREQVNYLFSLSSHDMSSAFSGPSCSLSEGRQAPDGCLSAVHSARPCFRNGRGVGLADPALAWLPLFLRH